MTRAPFACFALLLFTSPLRANDVKLAEAYWQRLPGVGWVGFDSDFNPVFHLEDGYHFAKTGTFVKYRAGVPHAPSWFDRAGRAWVRDDKEDAVHLWTGEKWEKFPYNPRHLFADSAGRVFLFDGTHVRVFSKDGKWTAQQISKTARQGHVGFMEQGGRVWVWAWAHGRERERDIGAWSLTDGKWKHHTIANGFHFHAVHCMYPMADGRILLLEYEPPGSGRSPPYYWHPDKKLTPEEMAAFGGKVGGGGGGEVAYGTDGTLYFGSGFASNSGWVAIDAKGKLHDLPKHVGLVGLPHAVVNGRHVVFATLGDVPPVLPSGDGAFVGGDRAGRFYFSRGTTVKRYQRGVVVTAAWPKHEKPGEVLRVEKDKVAVARVVKDDVGKLWAEPVAGGALLQWHAGKWIDTPVQPLFHPVWTARPASPWSQWTWNSARLFRLHGKSGSVLVVRIRDVYQLDEPPKDGERFQGRAVRDPDFPHPAPPPPLAGRGERPLYWLEAHLYRDGKWSAPTEIRKLLATESAALLADFPTTSGELSFCSLVNDGTRLWAAFDGKVLTADKSGKVTEAEWPREKPKNPLPYAMLSTLSGGEVLLSGPLSGGHTLSLSAEGKIVTEAFATPAGSPAANTNEVRAHWKLAKDGTLWYWTTDRFGTSVRVWHYRDGKWDKKKGVGLPLHEDATGDLWCLPAPPDDFKVLRVNGTETKEFAFKPQDRQSGFTTVPKGAVLWASGGRLYCLEPGAMPVLRWRVLSEGVYGIAPAATDDKGTVLFGGLRGSLK